MKQTDHSIESYLPDLVRLARATTPYPVTLHKDFFDDEEANVLAVHGMPWCDSDAELRRISDVLVDYCWDRELDLDFVVLPEGTVGAPDPGTRLRHPPTPTA